MKKGKSLALFLALFMMISCGDQQKQEETKKEELSLSVIEMVTNPLEYEGEYVSFDGVVGHICRTSGDKMRVLQKDDKDYSVLVKLGKFTNKIDTELEGNFITVEGVLQTEESGLDLPQEGEDENDNGEHECETTKEAIRTMEELGIDPKIRTYIELEKFELEQQDM